MFSHRACSGGDFDISHQNYPLKFVEILPVEMGQHHLKEHIICRS